MNVNEGRHMVMHPAWQAAHELLADPEKWFDTVVMERAGYTSAQVATAMRCMGYGDDVIVHLLPGHYGVTWELPAVWIPVDNNNSLDAFPGLMAMVQLPTLEEALDDPDEFAAGFVLEEQGVHVLPPMTQKRMAEILRGAWHQI